MLWGGSHSKWAGLVCVLVSQKLVTACYTPQVWLISCYLSLHVLLLESRDTKKSFPRNLWSIHTGSGQVRHGVKLCLCDLKCAALLSCLLRYISTTSGHRIFRHFLPSRGLMYSKALKIIIKFILKPPYFYQITRPLSIKFYICWVDHEFQYLSIMKFVCIKYTATVNDCALVWPRCNLSST